MASQGIYFTDELLEKAKARSEQLYKGKKAKLSAYVADLIERDLARQSAQIEHSDPEILFRIVDTLLPARGQRIRAIWEKHFTATEEAFDCSQAEFLAALLDAVIDAAEAGNLQLARYQALAVIGGRDWLSLSDAISRGDWATAVQVLRRIDPSRDNTPAAGTVHPTVSPAESISAVSKKLKENPVRPTQPTPAKH